MPKTSVPKYREILQIRKGSSDYPFCSKHKKSQTQMRCSAARQCTPGMQEARGSSRCTSKTKTGIYQTTNGYKISLTPAFRHSITLPQISSSHELFWNLIPSFGWDGLNWWHFKSYVWHRAKEWQNQLQPKSTRNLRGKDTVLRCSGQLRLHLCQVSNLLTKWNRGNALVLLW